MLFAIAQVVTMQRLGLVLGLAFATLALCDGGLKSLFHSQLLHLGIVCDAGVFDDLRVRTVRTVIVVQLLTLTRPSLSVSPVN